MKKINLKLIEIEASDTNKPTHLSVDLYYRKGEPWVRGYHLDLEFCRIEGSAVHTKIGEPTWKGYSALLKASSRFSEKSFSGLNNDLTLDKANNLVEALLAHHGYKAKAQSISDEKVAA